jgi:hypothetical protein
MASSFFAAGSGEIVLRPALKFVDKFYGVIPSLGHFIQALRKRLTAEDCPKHYGNLERDHAGNVFGLQGAGAGHRRGYACRRGSHGQAGNTPAEFATIHHPSRISFRTFFRT